MVDKSLDTKSKNKKERSLYPKLVYPHGSGGEAVRVSNIKEEQEIMGLVELVEPKKEKKNNW